MKSLRLLIPLLMVVLSPTLSSQFILRMNFSQMDAYIGKKMELRVTENGSEKEVGRKSIETISGASFSFDFYVLLQGHSYQVDFYVDENANAAYDAPPLDHAWRRTVNNATQMVTIDFTPDIFFTNIGFPDAFPFSVYKADWGGKWKNLTFGSTDTIMALFEIGCDSFHVYFTTKGIFGNPQSVVVDLKDTVSADGFGSDTIFYTPASPWSGQAYIYQEQLHGDLHLSSFQLTFTGTIGAKQIMALYDVFASGTFLANGYFYVRELDINLSYPELFFGPPQIVQPACSSDFGFICPNPQGGTGNYEYIWVPSGLASACINPPAGDYVVIVQDENHCEIKDTFTLTAPPPLSALNDETSVSCFGFCDATAHLLVTGGTYYPFTYDQIETDLCAGDYTITVTDENGCTTTAEVMVDSPSPLDIPLFSITNTTDSMSNGSVTFQVIGGTPPYIFSLNGSPYQASNFFTDLPAGEYEGCVMDINGCILCVQFTVDNLTSTQELTTSFNYYPNPTNSNLYVESDKPLEITMFSPDGRIVKQSAFSIHHSISLENFSPGLYILKFSDGVGQVNRKLIVQ